MTQAIAILSGAVTDSVLNTIAYNALQGRTGPFGVLSWGAPSAHDAVTRNLLQVLMFAIMRLLL